MAVVRMLINDIVIDRGLGQTALDDWPIRAMTEGDELEMEHQ